MLIGGAGLVGSHIIDQLVNEFEVGRTELEVDVTIFLQKLDERGLSLRSKDR